jgi:hypothetical protein
MRTPRPGALWLPGGRRRARMREQVASRAIATAADAVKSGIAGARQVSPRIGVLLAQGSIG